MLVTTFLYSLLVDHHCKLTVVLAIFRHQRDFHSFAISVAGDEKLFLAYFKSFILGLYINYDCPAAYYQVSDHIIIWKDDSDSMNPAAVLDHS
jgi:hypothetical protein